MKNCKKVLAFMLSVLMVFTMMTSSAVAVSETEETEVDEVFDSINVFIDVIHDLVGFFMTATGNVCVFCEETHDILPDDSDETTAPDASLEEAIAIQSKLFVSVHNLIGEVMAVLGDECPFCDEMHEKAESEESAMITD